MTPEQGIVHRYLPDHEKLNPILLESIYRLREVNRGAPKRSTAGGWHSTDPKIVDLPGFDRLLEFFRREVDDVWEIWAIINQKGHYNRRHAHFPGAVSAVYYVKVPSPKAAVVFYNGNEETRIEPEPGQLLIFSGALEHSVEVNESEEDRVVVACNFKPFDPPE